MIKSTLTKVGILTTLSIAALIWGVSFLKGKGAFKKENTYYAIYERIDGMSTGSPVFLSGFKIGSVTDIYFTPDTSGSLTVEFTVNEQVLLPKPTTARIFSNDLMGNKAIELILGTSNTLHNTGDTLEPDFEGSLKDMVSIQMIPIKNQAESLMKELEDAINIVNSVFNEQTQQNISASISRMRNTFINLDSIVYDGKGKIGVILTNIESISTMLKKNNHEISNTLSNVSSLTDSLMAANIKETIMNANSTLTELAEISAKINNGEGSAGQLINNDSLYFNIQDITYNLNLLIEDLKQNPNRYVHISVFGGKDKK